MKLYEQAELRELTGPTLRPGGLELTRRGLESCGWQAGDLVLDCGCGPGETLGLLRELGIKGIGLDLSQGLLNEAARKGPVLLADLLRLPLREALLDGAICECVLSLLPDKAAMLAGLRRAMKPGARLLLTDLILGYQKPSNFQNSQPPVQSCINGAESLPKLRQLVHAAGFAIRRESDESRALKELAVKMVFRYGSAAAFFQRWQANPKQGACSCSGLPTAARPLGYIMFVAEAVG